MNGVSERHVVRRRLIISLVALLVFDGAALVAQTGAPPDSAMRAIAARVVALDARRQWPTATAATIDSLLAYYSDSVVYEHPSVGAIVRGKTAMRDGMRQYLNSRPAVVPTVLRITIGAHVAVIEMPGARDPRTPNAPVPASRHAFRLLEFDQRGLVRRIVDYPW